MVLGAVERPSVPLHRRPPTSPSRLVVRHRWTLPLLLTAMTLLALAARYDGARLLSYVDLPAEKRVVRVRSEVLDAVFRQISFFGSTYVVLIGGAVLALAALPRCRIVAAFAVVATLARPPFEHVLKIVVDRQRPDLDRLVNGVGPSFPSGHVLAASVLWFLVPLVISLYVPSRRVWWAANTVAAVMVFLIGCSRVYLGVHWPTDVVGGFIGGLLLLCALDRLFHLVHSDRRCDFVHEGTSVE